MIHDLIQNIKYYTIQFFDHSVTKFIFSFIGGTFVYLFPSQERNALYTIFFLVVVDAIFAIIAAKMKGESFSSHKFRRTIYKCLVYFVILAIFISVDKVIIPEGHLWIIPIKLSYFFNVWVLITELISLLENTAKMGIKMPIFLIQFLKKKEKDLEDKLNGKEKL